jgi:glycosyltransferase involved in cell wall biosynthesis
LFAPYTGQDLFLELAAGLLARGLDARFWLIGDVAYPGSAYAAYAERLRARAAREDLRGRVRFAGRQEEIQGLLEQSHLLLHCTREPEPFGRVILEALQCGCEVVCHRGSGACELLETTRDFPGWMAPLRELLPPEYVRVLSPKKGTA